jgi:hypothetical protein
MVTQLISLTLIGDYMDGYSVILWLPQFLKKKVNDWQEERARIIVEALSRGLRTVSWDPSGISNRKVMNREQEDVNYGITTWTWNRSIFS